VVTNITCWPRITGTELFLMYNVATLHYILRISICFKIRRYAEVLTLDTL